MDKQKLHKVLKWFAFILVWVLLILQEISFNKEALMRRYGLNEKPEPVNSKYAELGISPTSLSLITCHNWSFTILDFSYNSETIQEDIINTLITGSYDIYKEPFDNLFIPEHEDIVQGETSITSADGEVIGIHYLVLVDELYVYMYYA